MSYHHGYSEEWKGTGGPTVNRPSIYPDFAPQADTMPRKLALHTARTAFWRGVVIGGMATGLAFIVGVAL